LGERLLCKQEVIGSIPFTSTRWWGPGESPGSVASGAVPWRSERAAEVFDNRVVLGRFPYMGRLGRTSQGGMNGQVNKGVRWMPWHQAAKKDVAGCDKPRGVASER
jgi:hypothetical protein